MNLAQIDACQDETRAINSGFFLELAGTIRRNTVPAAY